MWEDVFQVYRRIGEKSDLMASDMSLYDAMIFMRAWLEDNYQDTVSSLEIRRQPMNDEVNGDK